MRCLDYLSVAESTPDALEEICRKAASFTDDLGAPADLALLFVSPHHRASYGAIHEHVREATGVRHLIGCSAESVIADGREIEQEAGISLWLASLPDTSVEPFHLRYESPPRALGFAGLPEILGGGNASDGASSQGTPSDGASSHGTSSDDASSGDSLGGEADSSLVLLLGDPFSFPVDELIRTVRDSRPDLAIAGGMASAALSPGQNALYLDANVHDEGAVGVVLSGPFAFRTVVSQGCRPIGRRFVVTSASENTISSLAGASAKNCLKELFETLPEADRAKFQTSPHIGIALDEHREEFARGDFLIRNVLGWDPKGALALDDTVRRGQTVQFHVRDAASATEDLDALLEQARTETSDAAPVGALLFTCNGRGSHLFSTEHHDIGRVRQQFHDLPVAGFFAGGELGRVGDRNFLHGFTASVVLFYDQQST